MHNPPNTSKSRWQSNLLSIFSTKEVDSELRKPHESYVCPSSRVRQTLYRFVESQGSQFPRACMCSPRECIIRIIAVCLCMCVCVCVRPRERGTSAPRSDGRWIRYTVCSAWANILRFVLPSWGRIAAMSPARGKRYGQSQWRGWRVHSLSVSTCYLPRVVKLRRREASPTGSTRSRPSRNRSSVLIVCNTREGFVLTTTGWIDCSEVYFLVRGAMWRPGEMFVRLCVKDCAFPWLHAFSRYGGWKYK